jgi:hypothetical protein
MINLIATNDSIKVIHSVIDPIIYSLSIIAGLTCTALLIIAAFHYITSSGKPDKLERAKKIIKDCLIGLTIVLSAASLTSFLNHSYGQEPKTVQTELPKLNSVKPDSTSSGLIGVLIKAITGVLQNIVESIGKPFIQALTYFTKSTPLMADNNSVFNLWLIIVAIADTLFIFAIVLLGFNIMSSSSLGMGDIDIRQMLPQIVLTFLIINSSIFLIDTVISLSNGLIDALKAGFGDITVWSTLTKITSQSGSNGLATLLIMVVFLVLAFILMVYYVGRIVTLYLGAVLSPLLVLLWVIPSFKDFVSGAVKTYISTIFVLFIHVVILTLAASIFSLLVIPDNNANPDEIMSLIIGMSTLIALIKTQGVLAQLNYASVGPKSIRKLSSQFVNSFSGSGFGYKEV